MRQLMTLGGYDDKRNALRKLSTEASKKLNVDREHGRQKMAKVR